MIIVDGALRKRAEAGNPVRVAIIGAGFMGRGIANQIVNSVPGMELAAISNRNAARALDAYREAGAGDARVIEDLAALEDAVAAGRPAVCEDALLLCRAEGIDAIVEVTGAVEFGARMVLEAIEHGKHVVLMNAELDGTVGPILRARAERAGVVYSASDGDQPGVQMNLYRFVSGIGVKPLVCGNIKGLHDPRRNPTTQQGFARRWGQNPFMVTSFADGTKISFEQATVANATGMTVAQRGMLGWEHDGHVDELTERFDVERLQELGGIVDYVVGARPAPGVFVLGTHDDPAQRHYLNLYKLGEGPLYSFYTPYHLCHFEVPSALARAVLFDDAVMAPAGPPVVDVVTAAKVSLQPGDTLDAIGGYRTYGVAERAGVAAETRLLPMGLAEGCTMVRSVSQDAVLTYDDVQLPPGRAIDALRTEQIDLFASEFFGGEPTPALADPSA
jgi:predicted homoserine dehydrogenase-like protein